MDALDQLSGVRPAPRRFGGWSRLIADCEFPIELLSLGVDWQSPIVNLNGPPAIPTCRDTDLIPVRAFQKRITPKAFANSSPGLRSGNPGISPRFYDDATLKGLRASPIDLTQPLQGCYETNCAPCTQG